MAKEKAPTVKISTQYGDLMQQKRTYDQLEVKVQNISTGSLIFDIFTGGGYSPGISRFVAPPEHGKTLQALTWAREWLLHYGDKGEVHYFDCEGRLTPKKLNLSGITKIKGFEERFTAYKYNVYDDIAAFLYDLTMNNPEEKHYFIVFDSLDMLITKADTQKNFGEAEKVGAAQVMSTLLMKKVGPYMADKGHHLYIASQIRANISTGGGNPNSPKTKMSGANALAHGSDLTGEIQKNYGGNDGMFIFENPGAKTVKEKGNIVGHYCTIRFLKTMNEKTGQTIRIPIKRGAGVWHDREVCDLALAYGLIRKKSAWFELDEDIEKKINQSLTEIKKLQYVEQKVKEETEKGTSKAEIKKLKEQFEKEAEAVTYTVEKKWQGYENLFAYLEQTPDVVDWFDKHFRANLLASSVAFDSDEGGESAFE